VHKPPVSRSRAAGQEPGAIRGRIDAELSFEGTPEGVGAVESDRICDQLDIARARVQAAPRFIQAQISNQRSR